MGSSNNGTASGGSGLKTARNLPGATASEVAATQLTSLRGWGTLRKVDRERAETYLRLVAEAELRRATTLPRDGAVSLPDMPGAGRGALVVRQRSAVAAALYDLPIRQREVIALQFYGNLSEAQTAATVGLSRGAVHSFTAHGMSALQAALETGTSRVAQVAQVLTAMRALGHEVADQILDEFALALGTR